MALDLAQVRNELEALLTDTVHVSRTAGQPALDPTPASLGDIAGSKSMDLFPGRVASRAPAYSTGSDPAEFTVTFSVAGQPTLDAAVPTEA